MTMVDWEPEVCACAVRVRRVNAQGALQDTFRSKYWDDVAMKQTSNLGNFKARAWAVLIVRGTQVSDAVQRDWLQRAGSVAAHGL
jgi:hypothetical protein